MTHKKEKLPIIDTRGCLDSGMYSAKRFSLPVSIGELCEMFENYTTRPPKKDVLERLLLFLDFLVRRSDNGKKPIEVSNQLAEQYVSRIASKDGRRVRLLRFLCDVGILEKKGKHCVEAKISCRYELTNKRVFEKDIKISEKTVRKMENTIERKKSRLRSDPVYQWVEQSLSKVSCPQEELRRLKHARGNHTKSIESYESDNRWLTIKRYRITTIFSNFPNESRRQLLMDGKPVSCIDIPNSHLFTLVKYIRDDVLPLTKDCLAKEKIEEELCEFSEIVRSGNFYKILMPNHSKEKSKPMINTFFNRDGNRYSREAKKVLAKHFVEITKLLFNLTKNEPLGPKLQSLESKLIYTVVGELKKQGILW